MENSSLLQLLSPSGIVTPDLFIKDERDPKYSCPEWVEKVALGFTFMGMPSDRIPYWIRLAQELRAFFEVQDSEETDQEICADWCPEKDESGMTGNIIVLPFASRFQKQFDDAMKTLATG